MPTGQELTRKGYSEAEVEILLRLERMDERLKTVTGNYVTKSEFEPVQRIVYGLVGLVLVAVFGALVALVVMG